MQFYRFNEICFFRILVSITGLTDAFSEAENIAQEESGTNEGPRNSYTASSALKIQSSGKRIDYIMYQYSSNIKVEMKKYCQPLADRVTGCCYSYSDHEAITAVLAISRTEVSCKKLDVNECITVLKESVAVCNTATKRLINHKRMYWFITALLFMLLITTVATDAPFDLTILYDIIRTFITILMAFTFIMASLWNMIETNAVLAGKLAMEISLSQYLKK